MFRLTRFDCCYYSALCYCCWGVPRPDQLTCSSSKFGLSCIYSRGKSMGWWRRSFHRKLRWPVSTFSCHHHPASLNLYHHRHQLDIQCNGSTEFWRQDFWDQCQFFHRHQSKYSTFRDTMIQSRKFHFFVDSCWERRQCSTDHFVELGPLSFPRPTIRQIQGRSWMLAFILRSIQLERLIHLYCRWALVSIFCWSRWPCQ